MALRKPNSGMFQPGNRLGGRPRGSRNHLSEIALAMLGRDFAEHGEGVIEKVRTEEPATYLKIIASLLPKQVLIERIGQLDHLTDEEIEQLEDILRADRAKTVRALEQLNDNELPALVVEPVDPCKT